MGWMGCFPVSWGTLFLVMFFSGDRDKLEDKVKAEQDLTFN
jgi:hypothetical protein